MYLGNGSEALISVVYQFENILRQVWEILLSNHPCDIITGFRSMSGTTGQLDWTAEASGLQIRLRILTTTVLVATNFTVVRLVSTRDLFRFSVYLWYSKFWDDDYWLCSAVGFSSIDYNPFTEFKVSA